MFGDVIESEFKDLVWGQNLTEFEIQVLRKGAGLPLTLPGYSDHPDLEVEEAQARRLLLRIRCRWMRHE